MMAMALDGMAGAAERAFGLRLAVILALSFGATLAVAALQL